MKRYALIPLLLVACGDDGGNHRPIVDAPTGNIDARQLDARIDAPPAATTGLVQINQGVGDGESTSDIDVQFSNVLLGPTMGTDGPCTLYGLAETPRYSAGNITITGTTQPITMTANDVAPDVTYEATAAIPDPVFNAGATIQVTAAGGADVPAFNATVTGPETLAGFTPPATVSRSGYTATWTSGQGPGIWVLFAAIDETTFDGVVGVCRVNDTGTFTIPSTTWAMTPSTATLGFVGVARVAPTTVNAGGTMVIVQAISHILSGDVTITN